MDDEGIEFIELSYAQQEAIARRVLDAMCAAAELTLEPTKDIYDNLVYRGRSPGSGRPIALTAFISPDLEERGCVFGEVHLAIEMDHRLGCLQLVHDDDPGEPPSEFHAHVTGHLYVSHHDDAEREAQRELAAALGDALLARFAAAMRTTDQYALEIRHDDMCACVYDLQWLDEPMPALALQLSAFEELAALLEALGKSDYFTCGYCGARYKLVGRDGCPSCGAAAQ